MMSHSTASVLEILSSTAVGNNDNNKECFLRFSLILLR